MKYNKKFEPWIDNNEEKIFDKIDLGKSLDDAHEAIEKVKLWKVESEEMKAKLDKGNKAAKKMSNHENEDKIYDAFVKRWDVVNNKIIEVIPLIESYIGLWEKQIVIADEIQAEITNPHTKLQLPDLEKMFMDMKRLMFQKQKIMAKINPYPIEVS